MVDSYTRISGTRTRENTTPTLRFKDAGSKKRERKRHCKSGILTTALGFCSDGLSSFTMSSIPASERRTSFRSSRLGVGGCGKKHQHIMHTFTNTRSAPSCCFHPPSFVIQVFPHQWAYGPVFLQGVFKGGWGARRPVQISLVVRRDEAEEEKDEHQTPLNTGVCFH